LTTALRRSFNSLEMPNYRRYFIGQVISLSGNWMQNVTALWLVLSLTNSGVAVGLTTALQFLPCCSSAPTVVFSPTGSRSGSCSSSPRR
jgi:hypothetical protein